MNSRARKSANIHITFEIIQYKKKKILVRCIASDRFPARPYILDDYPKNLTVVLNSTAEFSCPVIADIAAHIMWTKNKAFNDTDGNITLSSQSLEVITCNAPFTSPLPLWVRWLSSPFYFWWWFGNFVDGFRLRWSISLFVSTLWWWNGVGTRRRNVGHKNWQLQIYIFSYQLFTDRVNHKPIITDPPQNTTLKIGESLNWKCKFISDLHKHVQWIYCFPHKNCSAPIIQKVMVVFYEFACTQCAVQACRMLHFYLTRRNLQLCRACLYILREHTNVIIELLCLMENDVFAYTSLGIYFSAHRVVFFFFSYFNRVATDTFN